MKRILWINGKLHETIYITGTSRIQNLSRFPKFSNPIKVQYVLLRETRYTWVWKKGETDWYHVDNDQVFEFKRPWNRPMLQNIDRANAFYWPNVSRRVPWYLLLREHPKRHAVIAGSVVLWSIPYEIKVVPCACVIGLNYIHCHMTATITQC